MKEKFSRLINKNLKWILIIGIVVVMAFGVLLVLISGNDEERDNVPIDPTAEQTEDKKIKKERKIAEISDHPGVSEMALDMYNARVDDISDTAQVAQLMEATDMRAEMGNYLVTLNLTNGHNVVIISYEREVNTGEDTAFDEKATWYAEQFLALIEEADEIQWTYKAEKDAVTLAKEKKAAEKAAAEKAKEEAEKAKKEAEKEKKDSDKKEEKESDKTKDKNKSEEEIKIDKFKKVEKSLTLKQATELLDIGDLKSYSETPELVQTLLNNQKGIV